jgi:hypothetical protein
VSIAELHPEHLLEKEARGELEPVERERLDAHLAQCATCRFERQVRADFAEDLAGEGDRISGLIRLAEEAAKRAPEKTVEPEAQKPALVRQRRRPVGLWFFAAAALLVVVSAAASEAGRRVWVPIFIHDSAPASPTVTDEVRRTTAPPPSPMLSNLSEPQPAEPVVVASAAAPVLSAPAVAAPTPSALLDSESDARRRGDYPRVIELHTQLVTKHPQSREAQVSRVTVARMLLDRGDPAGALEGFDAYLHDGSGELGEDAMAGRATALERLGRTKDARAAWASLVELYPASAYATHARARMEALADR